MTRENKPIRSKPERITGARHVFAAAGYSIGGISRLWKETAFRHIVFAFFPCLLLLAVVGAGIVEYSVFLILFLLLVAAEALNTAIECIVDHLAPQWEEFARDAKDLGSLATMCLLVGNGVFLGAILIRYLTPY